MVWGVTPKYTTDRAGSRQVGSAETGHKPSKHCVQHKWRHNHVVCFTGPLPLPKQVIHRGQSIASAFNFYLLKCPKFQYQSYAPNVAIHWFLP